MSGALYLELLNDQDLELLARAAGFRPADEGVARLRQSPDLIEELLGRRPVFDALLGAAHPETFVHVTPFLAFALVVNRSFDDFADLTFVNEWVGPGQRIPVFDVGKLREFASPSARRFFLAELLTSYTHVASGRVWTRTPRGFKRYRYSDLDPLRLAELLEIVPESDRAAIYRRLGDLALFIAGVFPDHAGGGALESRHARRLGRILGDPQGLDDAGPMERVEWLGRRSYLLASEASGASPALEEMASRFVEARRVLNFATDRYLFPFRTAWFGGA